MAGFGFFSALVVGFGLGGCLRAGVSSGGGKVCFARCFAVVLFVDVAHGLGQVLGDGGEEFFDFVGGEACCVGFEGGVGEPGFGAVGWYLECELFAADLVAGCVVGDGCGGGEDAGVLDG